MTDPAELHKICQAVRSDLDRELAAEHPDDQAIFRARLNYGRALMSEVMMEAVQRAAAAGDEEAGMSLACAILGRDMSGSTWEEIEQSFNAQKLIIEAGGR